MIAQIIVVQSSCRDDQCPLILYNNLFSKIRHAIYSIPKPIFHQVNGKQQRYNNQRSPPEVNPHHEEIVKYMSEGKEYICKKAFHSLK